MAQPSVHGRFIWQELMSTDTDAATSFYPKIVGWRVQAPMHPGSEYHVLAAASGSVGGVMPLSEEARKLGARPHWLPYIGAQSVDETVAAAERLGGKVLRPAEDVEDIGRYAVLADPQGAAFGIYHPLHPAASATKNRPQPGEFCWQELATSDHEAAFRFYSELFGWQALQRMDMGPAGTYLIFGHDGVQQGGIYKLAAETPAPYWLPYVEVPNTDEVAEQARAAGGRITNGPMDVPGGGRIAQLLDPDGVLFAIHTAAAAAAARPRRSSRRAGSATQASTGADAATAGNAVGELVAANDSSARSAPRRRSSPSSAGKSRRSASGAAGRASSASGRRAGPSAGSARKAAGKRPGGQPARSAAGKKAAKKKSASTARRAAGGTARGRSTAAAAPRGRGTTRGRSTTSGARRARSGSANARGRSASSARRSARAKVPAKARRGAARKSPRRR
jgi:predicted enzyme related to lactoylglutathione lyase